MGSISFTFPLNAQRDLNGKKLLSLPERMKK
jgi:hypothetical protein